MVLSLRVLLGSFFATMFLVACSGNVKTSDSSGEGLSFGFEAVIVNGVSYGQDELQDLVVLFDFDSYVIQAKYAYIIEASAAFLAKNTNASLDLSGYTDERGSRGYNLALGEKRALAVKDALISAGIDSSRLRTQSYGEDNPVAIGSGEANWSKNRRVEFYYK